MNEQLMSVVVEMVAFLANAHENIVDPDAAVRQLELISHQLKRMGDNEQGQFVGFVKRLAEDSSNMARATFLRRMPAEDLGLIAGAS